MIVDAHHHLWRDPHAYPWLHSDRLAPVRRPFTMADLAPHLSAAGVTRTVLVEGGRCDPAEAGELLGLATADNTIAGVVAWADLTDPALPDTIAALRTQPGGHRLAGIRAQVQHQPDPGWLDTPAVRQGLATIADAGLAYDLVVRQDQLAARGRAAAALPQLRFVLDHLGSPPIAAGRDHLPGWRDQLAALARLPNVSAKLSGLVTHANWATWTVNDLRPYVAAALALFGPDRLMYGSDWPYCLLAASYQETITALHTILSGLSPSEHTAVFAGTATRAYRLEDS